MGLSRGGKKKNKGRAGHGQSQRAISSPWAKGVSLPEPKARNEASPSHLRVPDALPPLCSLPAAGPVGSRAHNGAAAPGALDPAAPGSEGPASSLLEAVVSSPRSPLAAPGKKPRSGVAVSFRCRSSAGEGAAWAWGAIAGPALPSPTVLSLPSRDPRGGGGRLR